MRNKKECPKCKSRKLIKISGKGNFFSSTFNQNVIVAGLTRLKSIGVTRYIYRDCGFTEEWIDSKDDIEKINRLYSEVE